MFENDSKTSQIQVQDMDLNLDPDSKESSKKYPAEINHF